jgi:hypothetical protein
MEGQGTLGTTQGGVAGGVTCPSASETAPRTLPHHGNIGVALFPNSRADTEADTRGCPPSGGEFGADINGLLPDADAAWHVRGP